MCNQFQEQQNQARSSGAWWDRMKSLASTKSNRSIENIPLLKQDISALEELSRQLFLEIHDLKNMRERLEWSKTLQGKYFNFLGYFFSIYCTWKIFISTVNIVFDRVGRVDPITKGEAQVFPWYSILNFKMQPDCRRVGLTYYIENSLARCNLAEPLL